MKKTILEWFEEAKANGAEWADNAINTTIELRGPERLKYPVFSLANALYFAFAWHESVEKHRYWQLIYQKIEQEEENV